MNWPWESRSQRHAAPDIPIGTVARPGSAVELGKLLSECTARSLSVLPFGGGGSMPTGRVVPGFEMGIDTRSLVGIVDYQPSDLTLSVQAGTTMAEITSVLGEQGQEIPIDVPFPEVTTIGGLAATGFAGPRRLSSGTLKDAIIGCEYVRGDGLIAKAGGMVVKNVSGFEIPRLLHGSWGALAVLTSVNLKVTPLPRSEATVRAGWSDIREAITVTQELASRFPALSASTVDVAKGRISTSHRVMGREMAVESMAANVAAFLSGRDVTVIENDESRGYWQDHIDGWVPTKDETQIVIGCRPRDVMPLIASLRNALGEHADRANLSIAPGLGSIRVRVSGDDHGPPLWPLSGLSDLPDYVSGVLESGSESLRKSADPWGSRPEGYPLMAAIKRQFDPANVLNRGRLFV